MRVIYFSETLPPIRDGIARTLSHLGETLKRDNVEFMFFSPVTPDEKLNWADRVHNIASIPLTIHQTYRVGLPYFQDIYRKLDKFKPDIIHVISPTFLGIFGLNYAQRRGIPVVSSYHTHFISYFPYYGMRNAESLGWKYLQWFYNRCDATYAPSSSAMAELQSKGIQRVELWQRGIDTRNFSPSFRNEDLRRSIGADRDTPILLFVSRLVKEKDLDDLVMSIKLLERSNADFKVVIVGDGPERQMLQKKLPGAHFTGYLHGKELSEWYASSDLFVFPSTTETFGNVILEAFASGLPVITADKGGVADLVTPGINGFTARANDPSDFCGKIRIMLKNPGYRELLGFQAKIESAQYNWDSVNRKLIESYRRLTGRYGEIESVRWLNPSAGIERTTKYEKAI